MEEARILRPITEKDIRRWFVGGETLAELVENTGWPEARILEALKLGEEALTYGTYSGPDWEGSAYEELMETVSNKLNTIYNELLDGYERLVEEEEEDEEYREAAYEACIEGLQAAYDKIYEAIHGKKRFNTREEA